MKRNPQYESPLGISPRRKGIIGSFALVGMLVAAACGSSAPPAAAQAIGGSKSVVVGMKNLKFIPKNVTVKVNQEVQFRWDESVAHNVVFDKNRKSKTVAKKGELYKVKFDKVGSFKYKCTLHPGMEGTVKVEK
jgi:plastocyanin